MPTGIIRLDEGWRLDEGHHLDQPLVVPVVTAPPPVVPTKRKGIKTMDFMPKKRAEKYLWWKKLSANIVVEGPKFGLAPAQATAAKAVADEIIAKMEARDAADAAAAGALSTESQAAKTAETEIRKMIRNWKTMPGYAASGSEGVLGLSGSDSAFDPSTFKTVLKVSIDGGQIKIDFVKGGVGGVNVYCRLRGTTGWTKLAFDAFSPYYDTAPLAHPGTPETREYMARGVINDEEIGLDSDVVSILYAGL